MHDVASETALMFHGGHLSKLYTSWDSLDQGFKVFVLPQHTFGVSPGPKLKKIHQKLP